MHDSQSRSNAVIPDGAMLDAAYARSRKWSVPGVDNRRQSVYGKAMMRFGLSAGAVRCIPIIWSATASIPRHRLHC